MREWVFSSDEDVWSLFVDGSSCDGGSGAGLVLSAPDGANIEYALRFNFQASNNESEYEAMIAGLSLAKTLGVKRLLIHSDSRLVVNQVLRVYEAKDERMANYLKRVIMMLE